MSDPTVPVGLVNIVLDAKVNGVFLFKAENGKMAVGLRRAIVDSFQDLSEQATLVKLKATLVLEVAMKEAFVLLSEFGPEQRELWKSLCCALTGKGARDLQNLLTQTAVMLNDWEHTPGGGEHLTGSSHGN